MLPSTRVSEVEYHQHLPEVEGTALAVVVQTPQQPPHVGEAGYNQSYVNQSEFIIQTYLENIIPFSLKSGLKLSDAN